MAYVRKNKTNHVNQALFGDAYFKRRLNTAENALKEAQKAYEVNPTLETSSTLRNLTLQVETRTKQARGYSKKELVRCADYKMPLNSKQ